MSALGREQLVHGSGVGRVARAGDRDRGGPQAAAVTTTSNPALARALADTSTAFPKDSTPNTPLRAVDRARYHRLNTRYRTAHTWAGLILRGGGVTDLLSDGEHHADSLLLDLPRLWEAVVRRLAADAAAPLGGQAGPSSGTRAITKTGDLSGHPGFHPDVLLAFGADRPGAGPVFLPLDAKYKRYGERSVSAADVHQLLTYTAGYGPGGDPRSAVVHPSPDGPRHRTIRVTGPHGRLGLIDVIGLDPAADPSRAVTDLRDLCLSHLGRGSR
ncbi:5-methylcytosine restriction system specificity protein McrC [Kitasatospora griseola]|uniref:5-methylcytosine restriction system specificity protein McrC n=1 Tax=Kitasatospora griseola TaxID=2064 RepID=UPI0037F82758